MWLIWSGRGWVVPGAWFALLLAMEASVEWLTGDGDYFQQHLWPQAVVAAALSLALFVLVDRWEPRQPSTAPVEAPLSPIVTPSDGLIQTTWQRRAALTDRGPSCGSFMFIPLRWWRWLLLAIALGSLSSEVFA